MANIGWDAATTTLLRKWEGICSRRKKAHYQASNNYGWRNKLLSIPVILLSTILGSLSFLHPSFLPQSEPTKSRLLSVTTRHIPIRNLDISDECVWESHNSGDFVQDPPYCDGLIIHRNGDLFQSTLTAVDSLVCNREVNWVEGEDWEDGHFFDQYSVPLDITSQIEAEEWCVSLDQGYGVFYQKYESDGTIHCGVYRENTEDIPPVWYPWHSFGGVCLPTSGSVDSPDVYIRACTSTLTDPPATTPSPQEFSFPPSPQEFSFPPSPQESSPTPSPQEQPSPGPIIPTSPPNTHEPSRQPTRTPTKGPTWVPSATPSGETTADTSSSGTAASSVPYIIGGFNMLIAVLSALHTFLKYDALEDRHHQYSRHFGGLQVDIETLLAKTGSRRGDPVTTVESYKTKYAVLINNAPDLPQKLELICCADHSVPTSIELS